MKIRSGFVSNSSSSSYVILTTEKVYKDFIKTITDKDVKKIFVSEFGGRGTTAVIGDHTFIDMSRTLYTESFGEGVNMSEDKFYDAVESALSLVDDFVDYINKNGGYAKSH